MGQPLLAPLLLNYPKNQALPKHKRARRQPLHQLRRQGKGWRKAWLFAAPLQEPGGGGQEAEEKKTICSYALGKLNSRKQTVNIILHKTNRRRTEIHIQFLEVTQSAFRGA